MPRRYNDQGQDNQQPRESEFPRRQILHEVFHTPQSPDNGSADWQLAKHQVVCERRDVIQLLVDDLGAPINLGRTDR